MAETFKYLLSYIERYESQAGYRASVVTIGISDYNFCNADGSPTIIEKKDVPEKIHNIVASENVVFSCGSSSPNSNPGIDVYRWDEKDARPINRDHYSCTVGLTNHPNFKYWIRGARIAPTTENIYTLSMWILIKKEPIDSNNHHLSIEEAIKIYKTVSK